MPYPESCPECSGPFRNTGTHFTARRREVGRRVLLELSCQKTGNRFWWDFTQGKVAPDGQTPAPAEKRVAADEHVLVGASLSNGHAGDRANGVADLRGEGLSNGHVVLKPEDRPEPARDPMPTAESKPSCVSEGSDTRDASPAIGVLSAGLREPSADRTSENTPVATDGDVRAAFLRQLELDRLTLRQMRGWLASDEGRRAAEVAASATEATYERLALSLFGVSLQAVLGVPTGTSEAKGLSAEERLAIQREKARIRARERRAAIKAAKLAGQD